MGGYVPGEQPRSLNFIKLNTNENPYGPSEACVADIAAAAAEAARGLNRYPDREHVALREGLADYLSRDVADGQDPITPEQVWAANGSNEVMLQLLQAFGGPGRTVVSFAPTYSMYPEYARDTHSRFVAGRRAEDFTLDVDAALELVRTERPSLVLLPSPNNPTGTLLPVALIEALLDALKPGASLVVDEAFIDLALEAAPLNPLLQRRFHTLLSHATRPVRQPGVQAPLPDHAGVPIPVVLR